METKKLDLSWMKELRTDYESSVPDIPIKIDKKAEILSNIEDYAEEMRDNTKNQFWKNLLIAAFGGAIGGAIPYLLSLAF